MFELERLEGRTVALERITADNAARFAAGLAPKITPELFALMAAAPETFDAEGMAAYLLGSVERAISVPFCVVEKATGEPVGVTHLFKDDRADTTCEIGGTWYVEPAQGTAVNPDCKLTLLACAFDELGMERVMFMADATNARSRRGIEKLGARFEGTLHRHVPFRDERKEICRLRDSVVYAITRPDWPECRAKIEAALASRITPASSPG